MDIIIYDEETSLFAYSGNRPDFIPNGDPMQPGSTVTTGRIDICHSISFYTIVTGIVNALNYCEAVLKGQVSGEKLNCVEYIAGMIVSVLTDKVESANSCYDRIEANKNSKNYAPYYPLLIDINNAVEAVPSESEFGDRCAKHFIAVKASEIARLLNSEKSNLRYGNSKWNRSVLAAYDPMDVVYNDSLRAFVIENERDGVRLTNLITHTIGHTIKVGNSPTEQEIPGAVDALYFYTFETSDEECYVCSSSLPDEKWMSAQSLKECEIPIMYHNYATGDLKSIC